MSVIKKLMLFYTRAKFAILSTISKRLAASKALKLFLTPQIRNRKPLPPAFLNAEQLDFDLGGIRLKGYRWNKESDKKIQILHGFESSVVNFDHFINPLLDKGYQILAFDAPAHGRSEGKMIDALQFRDMIISINKAFGPIHSYIAHSFGGLALCLAMEKINHNENDKLVIIAPATETKRAMQNFSQYIGLNNKVQQLFEEQIFLKGGNKPEWYSVRRASANIKAQVLFLQDKIDALTPYDDVLPVINAHYPNFKFIISEGLGHRRIYKEDQSIKAIMEFLD